MSLVSELKRRNVFRIAVAYTIVAWLVIQVVGEIADPLQLPGWTGALVIVLLGIGFPVALVLAWAFELTPEGLKRERDVAPEHSITAQTGRKLDRTIIVVLLLALAWFAWDKYGTRLNPPRSHEPIVVDAETAAPADTADRKSIAVLPFENMSLDESNIPFTLGIHDDLLTHLSKIASIKTISRTSVLQYAETTKTVPQIADELGVATVLEGGVQRAGDSVRINVQLIDAATDEHLWAETYDRQLTASNIFQIQSEIATSIANALKATLSPGEQERIAAIPTENLAALESYFLGRQAMTRRSVDGLLEAIEHFESATADDPGFALAWSGMADTLVLQVEYSGNPPDETYAKALENARHALTLDSQSAEAHTSLANVFRAQGKLDLAKDAFESALEINPNYVPARHWYSNLLRQLGDYEGGMTQILEAIRIDPRAWVLQANLGTVLFELGRPADSMEQFQMIAASAPESTATHWSVGANLWTSFARPAEAVEWFLRSLENNPEGPAINTWLGLLYLDMDAESEASGSMRKAVSLGPDNVIANWGMALFAIRQGGYSEAVEFTDKVLQQDPDWHMSLSILRNRDLASGNTDKARTRYLSVHPELFEADVRIDRRNISAAIDVAPVLMALGEIDRANFLLDQSLAYANASTMPRPHYFAIAYGPPYQVHIHALAGRKAEALAALRESIDRGERGLLWYWLDFEPNLESIRGEPGFRDLREQVRTEAAEQLQRVRTAGSQ